MQKLKGLLLGLLLVGEGMSNPVTPNPNVSIYSTQQSQPSIIAYWNTVYPQIASCVSQVVKERLKPSTVDNDENSKDKYIASLGYGSGYYVMIDTSHYTTSDVCYIDFTLRQLGYTPHYIQPVERLIASVFARQPDALALADKLKAMKIDAIVKYIQSIQPSLQPLSQSNVAFSQPTLATTSRPHYITKKEFVKVIKTINKQFKNQNVINQQLYEEVQQLRQEIAQLKEEKKKENLVVAKAVSFANVRSSPEFLRSNIVKTLHRGDKVYLLGYSGDWAKIKLHKNSKNVYYVYKAFIVTQ